jgi:hypothetical protein
MRSALAIEIFRDGPEIGIGKFRDHGRHHRTRARAVAKLAQLSLHILYRQPGDPREQAVTASLPVNAMTSGAGRGAALALHHELLSGT